MFCENVAVRLVMYNNCVNNALTAVVVVEVIVDVVGVVVGGHHGYAGHLRAPRPRACCGPSHPTLHHGGVHLNIRNYKKYCLLSRPFCFDVVFNQNDVTFQGNQTLSLEE